MSRTQRRLGLALVVLGWLAVSVSVVAARTFPPPNPYDLQPGIREEGLYTVIVPGTHGYGHLWPMRPLYPKTPEPGKTNLQSAGFSLKPAAPTMDLGGANSHSGQAAPPVSSGEGSASSKTADIGGSTLGNKIASDGAAGQADFLENNIRDLVRRLNSK